LELSLNVLFGISLLLLVFRYGINASTGGGMNNIKYYRNAIKARQKDLGSAIGVGQSTIDRYESGERNLNISIAWNLVNALNDLGATCSFEDVFPNPNRNTEINNKRAA
jgi:putative transcriptional regulator